MSRTLTITRTSNWKDALRGAGARAAKGVRSGRYQGETLNFESPAQLFSRLTEKRWQLIHVLQGVGTIGVREAARRVGRDVKRVHEDLQVLAQLGLIERDADGSVQCPYDDIHLDMHIESAAA